MMLKYELKKVLSKRINRVLMVSALLLSVVFSVFAIGSYYYVDADGITHKGISAPRAVIADENRWRGELTPERIGEIVTRYRDIKERYKGQIPDEIFGEEIQSYYDLIPLTSLMLVGEYGDNVDTEAVLSAKESSIESIYDIYKENLQAMSVYNGETPEKSSFIMEQYEKIETPFYYESTSPWKTMYLYVNTFSIVLALIIGFLTAGIFAEEFQYRSAAVFFSAQYGRNKAVLNKIFAGLIIATLVFGCGMGLMSAICFSVTGISGATVPYLLCGPMYAIYPVSCVQMYGIMVLCGYVASLIAASVSMLVASKTRSMSIAVCIPFLMLCVSPFLGRALPFKTFFSLTPDALVNVLNSAKDPLVYQVGGFVFRQIPFIILFYIAIAIGLLPLVYRNYHRLTLK